jgi:hypothetical protein
VDLLTNTAKKYEKAAISKLSNIIKDDDQTVGLRRKSLEGVLSFENKYVFSTVEKIGKKLEDPAMLKLVVDYLYDNAEDKFFEKGKAVRPAK